MRSEFEKHYLSLDFYTKGSSQLCLDACSFDEKQDAYLPNMDWILENDADECVTYCCMLNTAYLSFKNQQSKVDELQKKNAWLSDVAERENKRANKLQEEKVSTTTLLGKTIQEKNELQKRVDVALKILSSKKKMYVDMVIEIEQALKGGEACQ